MSARFIAPDQAKMQTNYVSCQFVPQREGSILVRFRLHTMKLFYLASVEVHLEPLYHVLSVPTHMNSTPIRALLCTYI